MGEVIAPRRDESIIDENGRPSLRFVQYLEQSAGQVNETVSDTEIDSSSINLSVGQVAAINKRLDDIEIQLGIYPADTSEKDLIARIETIEMLSVTPVSAIIAQLQAQIDDLKLRVN